jgi:hypothetical protein
VTVLDRGLVRELLSALMPLRLASFSADFADVTIAIDVQSRMGCTPTIEIKGLRLAAAEVEATIEALAHLAERLGVFARELGAAGTGDEDDDQGDEAAPAARDDWPPPEERGGALPPDPPPPPPPVTPPLGTRRKGRPPGSRNRPRADPPAPPPEPAPSGTEAAPLPDPPADFTRAPAEPPTAPPSTPVHDEPPAQLTLPNPLPEPPDLTPEPPPSVVLEPPPLAGNVRTLLERLEFEGGSGDPRGWPEIPPELVGEAVARSFVRPLGGVEGAPALLRLTDTGWAELEKGRA